MSAVLQDNSRRTANGQEPPLLWYFQRESGKLAAGGGWDRVNAPSGGIIALTKGKGKGEDTAKRDFRAKASNPDSDWKGGDVFDGSCQHCGVRGHREAHCKHLDVEMAATGKGNHRGTCKGKRKGSVFCGDR